MQRIFGINYTIEKHPNSFDDMGCNNKGYNAVHNFTCPTDGTLMKLRTAIFIASARRSDIWLHISQSHILSHGRSRRKSFDLSALLPVFARIGCFTMYIDFLGWHVLWEAPERTSSLKYALEPTPLILAFVWLGSYPYAKRDRARLCRKFNKPLDWLSTHHCIANGISYVSFF